MIPRVALMDIDGGSDGSGGVMMVARAVEGGGRMDVPELSSKGDRCRMVGLLISMSLVDGTDGFDSGGDEKWDSVGRVEVGLHAH